MKEHTIQFKCIEDAGALRQRVCECFERAALPETSEEEAKRLLSFIIVGGGPTGRVLSIVQTDGQNNGRDCSGPSSFS